MNKDQLKIIKAMEADGLAPEIIGTAEKLLGIWADRLHGNRVRRAYYEGENRLKDLGISIPPPLKDVETVVGWPKKAVSALASRVRFDGFTAADEAVSAELAAIVSETALKRKMRQAIESELVAGCDFVTLSPGGSDEPSVIITTRSAEDCAAEWDERRGRIGRGLAIFDYVDGEPVELAIYDSSETIHVTMDENERVDVVRMAHRMGRPMMVALAYNPTESKPLGQSRINSAVRSITDSGVREALRTEISAEFFTTPQKYLLGADGDAFEDVTKWEAYIGSVFAIGRDENGDTPQFGQLSQGSMAPHVEYMRSLAARFSAETNIPVSMLGVIHDNPSSAEAIYAANEPLIIEADTVIEDNSEELAALARMALAVSRGKALDALTAEESDIVPHWKNPAMPSIVSQADAMVKIASVVPAFANTEVFWEQMGFDEEMRRRVMAQMEANQSRTVLAGLMGA